MNKSSPTMRRRARRLALQAIYQWQLTALSTQEIEQQFLEQDLAKLDRPYFSELLRGVIQHCDTLDSQLKPALDRDIGQLNPIELAILRLALYEFNYRLDVPYKVVIDEALRLAKTFGAVEGFKYVNGVLDCVAGQLRKIEKK